MLSAAFPGGAVEYIDFENATHVNIAGPMCNPLRTNILKQT